MVEARAISGGRVELEWLYDPAYEYLGPGAAHEARIYWDAGTGEIDFSQPHATVLMNSPTNAARFTWQSLPLTNGQEYGFTVRIGSATYPAGIEMQSPDIKVAQADDTTPAQPYLFAEIL
jgi:hypothetical protein